MGGVGERGVARSVMGVVSCVGVVRNGTRISRGRTTAQRDKIGPRGHSYRGGRDLSERSGRGKPDRWKHNRGRGKCQ